VISPSRSGALALMKAIVETGATGRRGDGAASGHGAAYQDQRD